MKADGWIIRLKDMSSGVEADSIVFRGTEAQAWERAREAIALHRILSGSDDIEIASVRERTR